MGEKPKLVGPGRNVVVGLLLLGWIIMVLFGEKLVSGFDEFGTKYRRCGILGNNAREKKEKKISGMST